MHTARRRAQLRNLTLPVANSVGVQIVQRVKGLSHDKGRLRLSQMLALGNVEEEFSTFAKPEKSCAKQVVRQDQIKLRCRIPRFHSRKLGSELSLLSNKEADAISFPGLMQLNDVWMVLVDKIESKLGRKTSINQVLILIF